MHPLAPLFLSAVLDGRFRIDAVRGSGNFGIVFRGFDLLRKRDVGIKVLAPTTVASIIDDFDVEDLLLRRLAGQSHVIDRIDSGVSDIALPGVPGATLPARFIVMEFAPDSLIDVVINRSAVPLTERLQLWRDYAKGVHQCHLQHVVHRDLKAENGLLVPVPGLGQVANIIDFGRARHVGTPPRRLANYDVPQGDMRYVPPELLWQLGSDDPQHWLQVDLYMLGSVLYELVVGQGLTMTALPVGVSAIPTRASGMPRAVRQAHFRGALGQLRQDYEVAYSLFDAAVPIPIRQPLSRVLRQLTDPQPERRAAAVRSVLSSTHIPWGLHHVLETLDRIKYVLDTTGRTRRRRLHRKVG